MGVLNSNTTAARAAGFLAANRVYHDRIGGQPLVVLTDASRANRFYENASHRFASWDGDATACIRERGW